MSGTSRLAGPGGLAERAEIERDSGGVAHYADLPSSLTGALRAVVERQPKTEALAEVGGARMS